MSLIVVYPLAVLFVLAAICDLRSLRIPNALPIGIAALFLPYAIAAGVAPLEFLRHLSGAAAVLLVGFALFAWRKIGAGDVKLIAAASLWFGWSTLPSFLILVAICGGPLALFFLALRQHGIVAFLAAHGIASPALEGDKGIPYGVAVAAGFLYLAATLPIAAWA